MKAGELAKKFGSGRGENAGESGGGLGFGELAPSWRARCRAAVGTQFNAMVASKLASE
jgi:hypothetical protein